MSNKLPLTISAEQQVCQQLDLSKTVLEKLEAWANFETLKANWYGDEANCLRCQFTLVTSDTFNSKFSTLEGDGWQVDNHQLVARKTGSLSEKHHIIFVFNEQNKLPDEQLGHWLGSELQVQLQAKLRQELLTLAQLHQLDAID